ncbi:MAG: molybdenum cofactor guanylyltransferase [Treponema sp.]|jgi:molybdopterin-guanine dinucleotide biosynthesis protein A|nr:molybdenum cofactor guanylyltransferase [Treponema sp.]
MVTGSALILAGGRGSRLGYDKKKLELEGEPVLAGLITKLGALFSEILVSSNEPVDHAGVLVLKDQIGKGPLAGIYQGLKVCRSEYLYVLACDMPFISLAYIRYMQDLIHLKPVDACVARRGDGLYEPFNSFFNQSCSEPIYEALVRHEYKISPLLDRLNLQIIDAADAQRFNQGDMFFNINYQADLELAQSKVHSRAQGSGS